LDDHRFDALARALSAPHSRRALGTILAAVMLLRGLAPDDAAARKSGACQPACTECTTCTTGKCKRKHGKKKCKPGTCAPIADGAACSGGRTCQGGRCGCSDGTIVCGQSCCPPAQLCQAGACVCASGTPLCGQACCRADQVCQGGTCGCPAGQEACGGACVPACLAGDQARNPVTCGCCLVTGEDCVNGGMIPINDAKCCSGVCNAFLPSLGHCALGAVGAPCNVGANCASGKCTTGVCSV
jgi:hypothetical protein